MTTIVQSFKGTGNIIHFTGVTAGDGMVLVILAQGSSTDQVLSVTDSQGNVWVQSPGAAINSGTVSSAATLLDIWYCAAAVSSGACSITPHFTASRNLLNVGYVFELLGTVTYITANSLRGSGTIGTPGVWSTPTISASGALFVMGAGQDNIFANAAISPGSWTANSFNFSTDVGPTAYQIGSGSQAATITYSANWNGTTDRDYTATIGAFTAAPATPCNQLLIQKATGINSASFAVATTPGNRVIVALAWNDAQREDLATANFSDGTSNDYGIYALNTSAYGGGASGIGPQCAILAARTPGGLALSGVSMQTLTTIGFNTTQPIYIWLYELRSDVEGIWYHDISADFGPGPFAGNNNATLPNQPVAPLYDVIGDGGPIGKANFYLAVEAANQTPVSSVGSSLIWEDPVSAVPPYNPVATPLPSSTAWTLDTVQGGYSTAYIESASDDQQAIWCETEASYCSVFVVLNTNTDCAITLPPPTAPCTQPTPPPPGPPCVPVGGNGVFVSDMELYIGPATALYTAPVPSADLNFYETTTEGRHAVVLDFNTGGGLYARDLGTIFSWPLASGTVLYVWQPSIIPMPEGTYGRATDWLESGGAKFIQGVIIEADSFNNAKTFMLQDADTLALHALNEMPATFNQQSVKAFSCLTPFVAHSARVVSTDGVEWRVWTTKLVFQPWPELCFNWQTEMTSLGMVGWGHVREMNVPYVSTSPVTLNLVFDAWPTITLTLPGTSGFQSKLKVTLPANKFKLISLQTVSGDPGHRIFADDLQLKIKAWGSTESYQVLRPFGGPSRTGATV